MRLHRPRVTLNVVAERFSDVEAQLVRFFGADPRNEHPPLYRVVSGRFSWHNDDRATLEGTVEVIVLGLPDPLPARWVESELHYPSSTLTLEVRVESPADVEAAVVAFVDNRDYRIGKVTADEFNTKPSEYHATVELWLHGGMEQRCAG